mgnify:CR=1 FL=1
MNIKYLVAAALSISSFCLADTPAPENGNWNTGWEAKEITDDGITTTCREHKTELNECKFELETDLSVRSLIALNTDIDNLKRWMANVMTSENVAPSPSNADYHAYVTYAFPGAISRDSITHGVVTSDPETQAVTLTFTSDHKNTSKPKELSKHFRFPFVKGSWIFTPLASGKTKIEYTNIGIPGGYVQKFMKTIYNLGAYDASMKTVRDMLEIAKESQYQNAVVDYVTLPDRERRTLQMPCLDKDKTASTC